jgi:hypothetical protein
METAHEQGRSLWSVKVEKVNRRRKSVYSKLHTMENLLKFCHADRYLAEIRLAIRTDWQNCATSGSRLMCVQIPSLSLCCSCLQRRVMSDKQADYDLLKAFKNRLNGELPALAKMRSTIRNEMHIANHHVVERLHDQM